jgi:acetyl-CoA acetyltransferase
MHELRHYDRERALIAMCVGVGQGVALALERAG